MKRFSSLFLAGALFFILGSLAIPSEVSATTFICSKCDVAYNDREVVQGGRHKERCPAGGHHYFYPGNGNGHPESTKSYSIVVSSIQGTWSDDSGTSISVIGKYFNGCRILNVHKIDGDMNKFSATLTLDGDEHTRKVHITAELAPGNGNKTFSDGTRKPRIYIDDSTYYKKKD